MKLLRETIRSLLTEIIQIPIPKSGERAVHKVEEEVTKEMLEDVISVLDLWENGEQEQVEALMQDLHSMGKSQIHSLMNAAEEMKNYGQINDDVPMWVIDYFEVKFSREW